MWQYFQVGILSGFGLKNTQESVYDNCLIKNKQATEK